ncbi:MAG: M56 family metallopeptidase [Ruminococcaceae bacterium]|nr:M56 family metallopeptidase [Oscillospiraceae bacterium]
MIEWIISSSLLILAVIALRAVFKGKIRPLFQYALWGIVLLRLLIPFSFFESSFSIMNVLSSLRSVEIAQAAEELSGYEGFDLDVNPPLSLETEEEFVSYPGEVYAYHYGDSDRSFPTTVLNNVNEAEFHRLEAAVKTRNILIPIWACGAFVVLGVFLWSNLRFNAGLRRGRGSKLESGAAIIPVYVSAAVETPCLFGIFTPAIYVTPECAEDERTLRHVLAHESTHYRHGDNIWGALRCLALALHWYNPLVWWAAIMSKRDAELACDEGTLRRLGDSERVDYGRTLIGLTCSRGDFSSLALTATTMTGSKRSIKERIIFIAKKPKMALYTLLAVLIIAGLAIGFTFSGVDSGFSDREARREAISLANSVAMANSCRIEGRGEILRYEGAPAEANPETNVQYVRVSYPTRNGLQKINVEFCMTDGKGQHYDEPFSATSWLSRSYTQIVPVPADYIESVHIWRDGYAPPVIPEAYREEIKEYVTKFFYADEYPTGALMGDSANDAGFTVFMKDGSSVSFGMGYAKIDGHFYKIAKPEETPDWLTELLVLPVRTKPAYGDLIKIDDTIKVEVDPYIISYAVDIMISQIDHYVFMRGIEIIDAKLTALECISTGAADQYGNAVEMYRVEYRLLPKNADGILLTDDMKMEDGWLTEWSSEGQPYMLFYLGDGNYREILRFINTEELDATYSTDTMLERYGNKYTAAAMEIYHTFVGQYGYQFYVMLGTGGAPIPPYYHEKHRVTYFPDSNGWLSGSGKPLDPNASFPTVTISDDPDDVNSDFLAFNRFIEHGELEIRDENFNILDLSPQVFYDGSDLYALPPGNYHVSFDITVPGKYISELGEHEWTKYMCIFRLEVVNWDNYSATVSN